MIDVLAFKFHSRKMFETIPLMRADVQRLVPQIRHLPGCAGLTESNVGKRQG